MALLQISNLSFSYPESARQALTEITFEVEEGELILLIGLSGCGKSTLLRHLKPELRPHGQRSGEVRYKGQKLEHVERRTTAAEIGFVQQNPETQIVTDTVWHELAFGLENIGVESGEIRRKVAEMAGFFGIEGWFRKPVADLSGGQKQILNLAAIMVMQPKLLLFDEPTAQLDPIAAQEFLSMIEKINRDLGVTVILSEHRLEEIFSLTDRVVVLEKGRILRADKPERIARMLESDTAGGADIFKALPSPVRIYSELQAGGKCPLTVREGRQWLQRNVRFGLAETLGGGRTGNLENSSKGNSGIPGLSRNRKSESARPVLEAGDVWFKYSAEGSDILRGISLQAYAGEILCVLGGNGAGKSTLLGVLSGTLKIKRGQVRVNGRKLADYKQGGLYRHNLVLLPQNPKALFVSETVLEELAETAALMEQDETPQAQGSRREQMIAELMEELEITALARRHPYNLSGGEQQKVGIAKLLLFRPKIILLDEPTKGLDANSKEGLAGILTRLRARGTAILIVTHDLEFAAEYGDRCVLIFDGGVVSEGSPREFFAGNSFYTTAANRMARGIFSQAVTCKDVIRLCQAQVRQNPGSLVSP